MSVNRHLVLGATGALGSAIVRQLMADEDKTVVVLVRDAERLKKLFPHHQPLVLTGDAADASILRQAIPGCTRIYPCLNMPYRRYNTVMPQVMRNLIDTATETGARIIWPSSVLVYGHVTQNPVSNKTPFNPHTRKGQARVELEREMMEAQQDEEVGVCILRLPDFYGPNVNNRMIAPIFTSALKEKAMFWPGKLDVLHEWVYIDDAAKAMIMLADAKAGLVDGRTFCLPGTEAIPQREFLTMIANAVKTPVKIRKLSPSMMKVAGLMSSDIREFREILYLYEEELLLSGEAFEKTFGEIPHISYEDGIRRTLNWFRDNDDNVLQHPLF